MGLFFPNRVFNQSTPHRSAMSKCNSDLKYLVNCRNISQCVKLNPGLDTVYAEVLQKSTVKGIQLQYVPLSSKSILCLKRWCQLLRLMQNLWRYGKCICGPVRWTATRGNRSTLARHAGQTGIPMRSFFFFTVFKPVSRRTSSSSDSSISSSAEKSI